MTTLPPLTTYETMTLLELSQALPQLTDLPQLHDLPDRLQSIARRLAILAQPAPNPLTTNPDQFRLLIAGSRYPSPSLLSKAQQAVERAHAHGWLILVGDAVGVDSTVIATCEAIGCTYVCIGIDVQPRSTAFRCLADGGYGHYIQFAVEHERDYAARDRYLADLAQLGLCLWNGSSKGTIAVHAYLQQLGKPVHLLTDTPTTTSIEPTSETAVVATVELIVDTQDSSHSEDATKQFRCTYGLRALDKDGVVLHQKREQSGIEATSNDFAKLQMLAIALHVLHSGLKGNPARYRLKIMQSSRNIEGWLSKGYKRNTAPVKTLCGALDNLLRSFPHVEWLKLMRDDITALVNSIP